MEEQQNEGKQGKADGVAGLVREVKTWRRSLDSVLQEILSSEFSPERDVSTIRLKEAIMWLGLDLKRLNEPDPYPKSYDPDSPVVHPASDGLKL